MMLQLFNNNNKHHFDQAIQKLENETSNKSISKSKNNNSNFTLDANKEDIRHAIGVAFAGNESVPGEPIMDWALGHHAFESQEERVECMRFLTSFPFLQDLKANSFQLCDQGDPNGSSSVASFASVQEYDPKKHIKGPFTKMRHNWESLVTFIRLLATYKERVPALLQDKKQKEDLRVLEKKCERYVEEEHEWHRKYGPEGSHWYVHLVGVHPDFQGQGKGKQLMNKLCDMADRMGQDMYLEAGERNRPFYEKFGFLVTGTVELEDPKDASNKFPVRLMTRRAAKPTL